MNFAFGLLEITGESAAIKSQREKRQLHHQQQSQPLINYITYTQIQA